MSPPAPVRPLLLAGTGIVGGMEKSVLHASVALRALGHRVLVGIPYEGPFAAMLRAAGHPPSDVHVLPMGTRLDLRAVDRAVALVRDEGVTVVHSHLVPADILGTAVSHLAGVPCVSTLHGVLHAPVQKVLNDLYRMPFFCVSEAGRREARALGLRGEDLRCVETGIDLETFDPVRHDRAAVRAALGVADDRILLLAVTRLAPEKTPGVLLDVASRLCSADARFEVRIAGTGPLEAEVRARLAALPGRERIRLLGSRDDVAALLAAADVSLLCSRYEGVPLAVIESVAMGVPVVAHDVGGVAEALRDGGGYLVPFGDVEGFCARVRALADDAGLRARLAGDARDACRARFSSHAAATRLVAAYDAVCTREPAPVAAADEGRADGAPSGVRSLAAPRDDVRRARDPVQGLDVVDAHLHLSGRETLDDVERALDTAGIAGACLIGPFLEERTWVPLRGDALRRANEHLLSITGRRPERCHALVTVDPLADDACEELRALLDEPSVRGLKLVPHGFAPGDPCMTPLYAACAAAGLPILFHSGIFISGRCSHDCRPAAFEAVRAHPGLTVVLAHLGWPWTDEAIAVALMDPLRGARPQILLDTSPGTPPPYRHDAMTKALQVLGPELLLFGSDRFLPIDGAVLRERLCADVALWRDAGASDAQLADLLAGNARRVFASRAGRGGDRVTETRRRTVACGPTGG